MAWLVTASNCKPHLFVNTQEGQGSFHPVGSVLCFQGYAFRRVRVAHTSVYGLGQTQRRAIPRRDEVQVRRWLCLADEQSRPTASQQFMSVQSAAVMERTSGHFPSGGDKHGLKAESGAGARSCGERDRTPSYRHGSLALQCRLEPKGANKKTVEKAILYVSLYLRLSWFRRMGTCQEFDR